MPERERNSEIRRKSPEIAMKSGQKPGDLDMLRSEFPDAFSGTAYTESLCQEAVKLSQEISALFQNIRMIRRSAGCDPLLLLRWEILKVSSSLCCQ